jgi:hypothetical protein
MDNDNSKEDNKSSNSHLFYGNNDQQENGKNKLDAIADSQEDLEAIEHDENVIDEKEATYQNLRGNKNNGLIHDHKEGDSSEHEEEAIERLGLDPEERKNNDSNADRVYNEERGGSATPFDAGNLDSPNSSTHIKIKKGSDKDATSNKSKSSSLNKSLKNDDGWDNNPKKGKGEDDKHDEEKSLLDPDNEDNIQLVKITKNI